MIIVEGAIGVGKSTLSKHLSKYLNVPIEYEKIETPLLGMFYEEPEKYAFHTQVHFLNSRFRDIKKLYHNRRGILDRSWHFDKLFARVNAELGRMKKVELDLYNDLFDNMAQDLNENMPSKHPDLLVYLQADFDVVMNRMYSRARGEEIENLKENYNYFKYLHSEYDKYVFNEYDASPVLFVDTNNFNVHDDVQRIELFEKIKTKLKELNL